MSSTEPDLPNLITGDPDTADVASKLMEMGRTMRATDKLFCKHPARRLFSKPSEGPPWEMVCGACKTTIARGIK